MFNRPALADLITRIRADVLQRLAVDDPLRQADAEVYSRVLAGGINGLYGYLDWLAKQLMPDTAESEYLDRWASIWLSVPRKPAVVATGIVAFTVQTGAVIPAGTILSAVDGTEYQTTASATVVGATATAPIAAIVAGIAGNKPTGQTLNLSSPITGVQTAALTSGAVGGGSDIELDPDLTARLLARIQQPPHGGTGADYVEWALEVPGVTRAWCYPGELGAGTVTVRFMRDNDVSPIPDSTAVANVQAYINALRPVTANVTVVAPVAVPLNFTIALTPNNSVVQAAVQASLVDLIKREASPGGYYADPTTGNLVAGGTMLLSHMNEAIALSTGETDHTMSVPSGNVTNSVGNITAMGTITWM